MYMYVIIILTSDISVDLHKSASLYTCKNNIAHYISHFWQIECQNNAQNSNPNIHMQYYIHVHVHVPANNCHLKVSYMYLHECIIIQFWRDIMWTQTYS